MNTQLDARSGRRAYIWLALAAGLGLFANGHWIIPAAAWLSPLFLLRFVRTTRHLGRSLIVAALLTGAVQFVALYGMIPLPPVIAATFFAVVGLAGMGPYLLDRFVARRVSGIASTLTFPLALTAFEFLLATLWTHTTWGSAAYSQYGNLPLMQLASLTGIWGITFLIGWFAAVAAWAWDQGFEWRVIRGGVGVYAGVAALVLAYGGVRLLATPPAAQTVRAAAITSLEILDRATQEDMLLSQRLVTRQALTASEVDRLRDLYTGFEDDLLRRTEREARAGAQVIFWPEGSLVVFNRAEETALIERGSALARQEGFYLGLAFALLPEDPAQLNENKIVLIDPQGEVVWTYFKARPVPVVEEPFAVKSSGLIPVATTPFGQLGAVICYDMDDQAYLRQAGLNGVDLLFAPSGDWQEIDPMHTQMAVFRAIEQGFALVRPTNHGLSIAVDPLGRVVGQMDHFTTVDRVLVANVPAQSVPTLYTQIGDTFAWLCVAGLAAALGLTLARRAPAPVTLKAAQPAAST